MSKCFDDASFNIKILHIIQQECGKQCTDQHSNMLKKLKQAAIRIFEHYGKKIIFVYFQSVKHTTVMQEVVY